MINSIQDLLANPAHFKTTLVRERFILMAHEAQQLALDAFNEALLLGVEHPVFTDTVTTLEEDKACAREHDQHRRRVAFDMRVSDWNGEQIDALEERLNKRYASAIGYVTGSGKTIVVYYHNNGHGYHFHCAVNARYKQDEYKG